MECCGGDHETHAHRHIVRPISRRKKGSGLVRAFALGRDKDMFEHLFVAGEKSVVKIKHKTSRIEHGRRDKAVEHEHFIGNYRYSHKHSDAFKPHEHTAGEREHQAELPGGNGGKPAGSARTALIAVLTLSCVILALGCVSLVGVNHVESFFPFLPQDAIPRARFLLKVIGPSFVFCGAAFVVASSSYFGVLRYTNKQQKQKQKEMKPLGETDLLDPLVSGQDQDIEEEEDDDGNSSYFFLMCLSHTLSAWEDRMWQFAVPILMMHIFRDTLLPGALFALVQYLGCVVLMPIAGNWIDQAYRLKLVWYAIMVENISILVTCAALTFMVWTHQHKQDDDKDKHESLHLTASLIVPYLIIVVTGVTGEVTNQMQTIALENDWVVVMTNSNSEKLTRMNVILKRIDLLCKVLAPCAIGIFLDFYLSDKLASSLVGVVILALWNMLSWSIEYCVLREVHEGVSDLKQKPIPDSSLSFYQRLVGEGEGREGEEEGSEKKRSFFESFDLYWRHPVFLASLAYSMLFMTVLDNGTLITSYLTWRNVKASILGLQRGMGAIVGLGGTFAFTFLVSKEGNNVEKAGLTSIWFFAIVMAPSVVVLLLFGACTTSDYALIGGMIVSRAFLWMFDLAERQLMQEMVDESSRGVMNSMQIATYQSLYCIIQGFGMIFSRPADFVVLTFISLVALLTAAVLYTIWYARQQRKHNSSTTSTMYSRI
jgi:iron-regulated transporter 1